MVPPPRPRTIVHTSHTKRPVPISPRTCRGRALRLPSLRVFRNLPVFSAARATAGPKPLLRLAWPQAITDPFPHLLPRTRCPAMTSDVSPPGLGPLVAPPASELQGLLPRSSRAPAGPPTAFPLLAGPAALASPAGPRALGPPGSFLCSGVNLNASATAHDGFHKYFIK